MRMRLQPLGTRNRIGQRVENTRKQRCIKQKDLLAKLQVEGIGITASALSKIEGQIRMVSDHELAALSNVLGVSPEWLLTGK